MGTHAVESALDCTSPDTDSGTCEEGVERPQLYQFYAIPENIRATLVKAIPSMVLLPLFIVTQNVHAEQTRIISVLVSSSAPELCTTRTCGLFDLERQMLSGRKDDHTELSV